MTIPGPEEFLKVPDPCKAATPIAAVKKPLNDPITIEGWLRIMTKKGLKRRYFRCFTQYLYMYKDVKDLGAYDALELDTSMCGNSLFNA